MSTKMPTPPQTSHKAHTAGLTTAIAFVAAALGYGEMPPLSEIQALVELVASTALSYGVGFAMTFIKRNYLKSWAA